MKSLVKPEGDGDEDWYLVFLQELLEAPAPHPAGLPEAGAGQGAQLREVPRLLGGEVGSRGGGRQERRRRGR